MRILSIAVLAATIICGPALAQASMVSGKTDLQLGSSAMAPLNTQEKQELTQRACRALGNASRLYLAVEDQVFLDDLTARVSHTATSAESPPYVGITSRQLELIAARRKLDDRWMDEFCPPEESPTPPLR